MLPGIRFLFAAIALSVSILIFGLGAAALLRAAHEEFSSNSSWRAAPEPPMVAQQPDASRPTLAMLRFDPPPGARETATDAPVNVMPASPPQASPATSAPDAVVPTPPEPSKVAALNAQETPKADPVKADAANADMVKVDAAPAPPAIPSETAKPAMTATDAPAVEVETKVAKTEDAKPAADEAVSAANTDASKPDTAEPKLVETEAAKQEPAKAEPAPDAATKSDAAATRIATLGGSPVAVEDASPRKDTSEKAERKARARAEAKAERAKARRRLAAQRARLARQRAAQQQPLGALFGQQTPAATN